MSFRVLVPSVLALTVTLLACGGGGRARPLVAPGLPATTTLGIETGNNTSAADSFGRQTNGNAGAGNVSKLPIRSLLYAGATTKIFVRLMPWFDSGVKHLDVGYRSDDPAQVKRQVEDMMSRGIDGAVVYWGGPNQPVAAAAALALKDQAEAHRGFQFAVSEDSSALADAAARNQCAVTDQLIADLNSLANSFTSSPAYLRIDGRPVVFFFGQDSYYVDWTRVRAAIAGNPIFMFRGTNGLSRPEAQGGFQWLDVKTPDKSPDPLDPQLAAQDVFYTAAAQQPTRLAFGSAYKGFNDALAKWGSERVVAQRCGQTWLATFGEVAKFYSPAKPLDSLQIVTWNDYEEGTAIEVGVDNCVYISPTIAGSTLSWTVNGGNENTIDHYTIFLSSDGQNLGRLGDVAAGTHSFDLGRSSLPAGNYAVYVKAIGRASIQNKISPPISYHPGDQPPVVALAVSQTGNLSYTASTAGSTDADGTVAATQIDFGDGTITSGPTVSHTYAAVGTYDITAVVTDNLGATAVATRRVSVKPAASGVSILAPANGATVNWPTTLVAAANLSRPVVAMRVYVDGQQAYATDQDNINTSLKVFAGTHQVLVQAFDNLGGSASATISVTAEPGNLRPAAALTVQAMPSVAPLAVLACTTGSHDPDGFIMKQQIQFSDGTVFTTPGALHIFASPGAYSAITTVTDQFGASGTATQGFNVPQ